MLTFLWSSAKIKFSINMINNQNTTNKHKPIVTFVRLEGDNVNTRESIYGVIHNIMDARQGRQNKSDFHFFSVSWLKATE